MKIATAEILDLNHTLAGKYLSQFKYPWQALEGLRDFILMIGPGLPADEYDRISPDVWAHKTAIIAPTAFLGAPCIIGPETEVRHCAFIRGSVLVGGNCVVGNSSELKNAILSDNVQTPHFNYVGDSILGYGSHLGAGAVTSNMKSDRTMIVVNNGDEHIETGLKKLGAILGNYVEVGCNSVLNPGTVIGPHTIVYPVLSVRGVIPADCIVKSGGIVIPKR